jgi:hypothetical protein
MRFATDSGLTEFMFPEADDGPDRARELTRDCDVALHVSAKLWKPVTTITTSFSTMIWTAVPQISVNKDGEALAAKYKIGATWQRLVTPPSGDTWPTVGFGVSPRNVT